MDAKGNIYRDDEDNIPAEDKARLDGYLRGRAEKDTQDELARVREEVEALREAALRERTTNHNEGEPEASS